MQVEPKIIDLKGTHIWHGLEKLDQQLIRSGLWNRLRHDPVFLKNVADSMKKEDQENPGEMAHVNFTARYPRLKLSAIITEARMRTLKDDIITKLKPSTNRLVKEAPDGPWRQRFYLVNPGYTLTEEEARMELARRNLVPANTDDGLAYMIVHGHGRIVSEHSVIVLDSYLQSSGSPKEFLQLGCPPAGYPCVTLWGYGDFSGGFRFLAKRPPKEAAKE